jgi:hypothetical protein
VSEQIERSEVKIEPSDPETNDEFGWSLGVANDLLIGGAPLADDAGGNSGTAYLFQWDGRAWRELAKLVADDGREGDWFGKSVAVAGDSAVVGANLVDGPLRGEFFDDDTGAAYVFVRVDGDEGERWQQQAKLRASEQIEFAEFGFAVAIEGDTIAVAAWHDPAVAVGGGAVYVFRRTGTVWREEAQLLPSEGAIADEFGIDIALNGDTILVGAHRDDGIAPDAGAAYVFRRVGDRWVEEAILRSPSSVEFDEFGWSVGLDGDTAIIGAPFHDGESAEGGTAYIFEREGGRWSEAQRLVPSDPLLGAWFGRAVAIAGGYALVGAPRYDRITLDGIPNELFNIGASYLFQRQATGWVQIAQLTANDAGEGDDFGWTVAMTPQLALVGAWLDDTDAGPDAGSAYSFVVPR